MRPWPAVALAIALVAAAGLVSGLCGQTNPEPPAAS